VPTFTSNEEFVRHKHVTRRCGGELEALDFFVERDLNIVTVDEALEERELADPRQAQIVGLRFFAGLTVNEIETPVSP
jgi:hypothetical protein